jgi:hypothetical protein
LLSTTHKTIGSLIHRPLASFFFLIKGLIGKKCLFGVLYVVAQDLIVSIDVVVAREEVIYLLESRPLVTAKSRCSCLIKYIFPTHIKVQGILNHIHRVLLASIDLACDVVLRK